MSDSITGAYTFIQGALTGDTTFMGLVTGVFADFAPQGTQPDYCVVQSQAPSDTLTATGVRIMSRNVFQVKVVGPSSHYSNISTAYARADALLGLVRSQGGILSCVRQAGFYLPQVVDGIPWVQLGGLYRVEL